MALNYIYIFNYALFIRTNNVIQPEGVLLFDFYIFVLLIIFSTWGSQSIMYLLFPVGKIFLLIRHPQYSTILSKITPQTAFAQWVLL